MIFICLKYFLGYLQLNLIGTDDTWASNAYIGYIYIRNTCTRVAKYIKFVFIKTIYIRCTSIYGFDIEYIDNKNICIGDTWSTCAKVVWIRDFFIYWYY